MKIVLATGNAHKVDEISRVLPTSWEVVPQSHFSVSEAVEDGLTFVENALIKARHAARATGLPAIADDSGLEVDALAGRPGIYSSRYAGPGASDDDNNRKLLGELEGVEPEQRLARFQCVIVMMAHAEDPTPIIASGTFDGVILDAPRGDGGFGYDPLFFVPDLGKSVAELGDAKKDEISHRAIALKRLRAQLAS